METPKTEKRTQGSGPQPTMPYWEDPVYHHLSRQHRTAVANGDIRKTEALSSLMQDLANRSMPDDVYWDLAAGATADRRTRKQERKKSGKRSRRRVTMEETSANVRELKKRIFNPSVSRMNVIKALESLPTKERRETIATLPPGLRRKLGVYLRDGKG